jgi:hypothetical protein
VENNFFTTSKSIFLPQWISKCDQKLKKKGFHLNQKDILYFTQEKISQLDEVVIHHEHLILLPISKHPTHSFNFIEHESGNTLAQKWQTWWTKFNLMVVTSSTKNWTWSTILCTCTQNSRSTNIFPERNLKRHYYRRKELNKVDF